MNVSDGLDFILSHFEEPLWPRTISTKQTGNRQIVIHSKEEALGFFATSEYVDCRVAGFGKYHQQKVIPNMIFVDLDDRTALSTVLILFHKTIGGKPTVLDTGNGYAVLQPLSMKAWNDSHVVVSYKGKSPEELSKLFLQWAERFLTNQRCDLANHPSLKNMMIRIPGTYNGKFKDDFKQVNIVYGWDKNRVTIEQIRSNFISPIQDIVNFESKQNFAKVNVANFTWVEKLFSFKIQDGRERLLYDATRYLINLNGLSIDEATTKIVSWLDSQYYTKNLTLFQNANLR